MRRPLLLASLLAACSPDLPDKPVAPDMSALVAAYATPTATFDQPTADGLMDRLKARLDVTDELEGIDDVITDVIDEALAEDDATARRLGERRDVTIEGEGFIQIHHICRGFGEAEPPIDAAENGSLEATVGFSEGGIDPVLWGTLEDCESVIRGREVLLDGGIELFLGEEEADFGDAPILFNLDASVVIDGEEVASPGLDFQLCPGGATTCPVGTVELLLETDGGEHLNFFIDGERTTGGFRAANGIWHCDFDEGGATCRQAGAEPVVLIGFTP